MLLPGRVVLACVLTLGAASALVGCAPPGPRRPVGEALAASVPRDLAQPLADLEVAARALAPACTTVTAPHTRYERCRQFDGGHLVRSHGHLDRADGGEDENVFWYVDDRPWAAQATFRRAHRSLREPFLEMASMTFYSADGRVVWAGVERDGRPTVLGVARYAWLERKELKWARDELEAARTGAPAPRPAGIAGPQAFKTPRVP